MYWQWLLTLSWPVTGLKTHDFLWGAEIDMNRADPISGRGIDTHEPRGSWESMPLVEERDLAARLTVDLRLPVKWWTTSHGPLSVSLAIKGGDNEIGPVDYIPWFCQTPTTDLKKSEKSESWHVKSVMQSVPEAYIIIYICMLDFVENVLLTLLNSSTVASIIDFVFHFQLHVTVARSSPCFVLGFWVHGPELSIFINMDVFRTDV